MRRSNIGKRRRQIGAISDLFFSAGGRNLYDEIGKRVKAGNCSIFEIGSGFGVGLKGIQRHWQRKGYALQISGIDIFSNEGRGRKFANIRTGNALSKPFPKADIIFSLYTLGYIGNFGFLIKKAGQSLNPKGLAILHINEYNVFGKLLKYSSVDRLARNIQKMKIPECAIKVKKGLFLGDAHNEDDIIVTIEKK